jgi:hypothetical protein
LLASTASARTRHKGREQICDRLSHTLKNQRGRRTSDDATLFMIEWHGGSADHLAELD